jgi:hypothetical protein
MRDHEALSRILVGVGLAIAGGVLIKVLWNWVAPGVFGLPVIDFKEALALLGLAWLAGRLLFGRHGHHRVPQESRS